MSSGKCKLRQHWDTTTHLLEWPEPGTLATPKVSEDVEQQGLSFISSGNQKWYQLWKMFWWFLRRPSRFLSYNPAVALLGIYPKEFTTCNHTNLYMMYIVALFIILKTWKQPWCLSGDPWKNKLVSTEFSYLVLF